MMILTGLSLFGLLALVPGTGEAGPRPQAASPDAAAPQVRRVVIRNQLIIRVPVQRRRSRPFAYAVESSPRCFASDAIAGARLAGPRSIDFLLKDRQVMRVDMDSDCPSLDFYGGFYVQPDDERLCVRRDVIKTRMGGSCRIERFRLLRPTNVETGKR